ncbi:PREDICTED: methyltransferase-like protein 10 [Ceratosolen solmsi marchali]|uniref:Protein-lysine N-methyltransferase LOC105368361 n=1 Tax=Ceratosolen solmsi marchali TaxID=326594 RepID=A0AAJ6YWI3_9HYME|nr:PREDICTED: methyltransferase-like protein 10 [Ceratosolen solmsi marchali]
MEKSIDELTTSELGTLEYWEKTYSLEIENFQDHSDVGEVWFGTDSSIKIVKFISTRLSLSKESDRIIDVGCGNGMTLVDFAKAGYENLIGVDYSQKAIDLARKVVNEEGFPTIKLQVHDIIAPVNVCEDHEFQFKLAHDKGTYDAISLHPHDPGDKRKRYIRNVHKILSDGGFFALTSCNWTKDELIEHFKDYFQLVHELPSKTFSFGGQTGNKITQLIFVKK